ncbi:class I SAM-dependent methyltransferase [bacterium]|nr:class I SAM-dependent methyltransferase [bacterium]
MAADFISLEKAHFDKAAGAFTQSHKTLKEKTAELVLSPVSGSYTAWLRAVRSLTPAPAAILDYCAGMGLHALTLQRVYPQAEVTAIDISEKALQIGAEASLSERGLRKPRFIPMDAHQLEFAEASFDLVSDFGSLSSLDFEKATAEIWRVLRPGGTFIAVETFGHNPLMNLWRRRRVQSGTRTAWCAENIVNYSKLDRLRERFADVRVEYHSLLTLGLAVLPFRAAALNAAVARVDNWMLNRLGLFRSWAFKVVVTARKAA